MKVLVVDDERAQADVLTRLLRRSGHEVLPAYSPEAAVVLLETHHVDVVISDCDMPYMTGPELFRERRQQGEEIPWVFVSGIVNREDIPEECRFLVKPVSVPALLELLQGIGGVD